MRITQCICIFSFVFLLIGLSSCVDPTNLGSDLLEDDRAEVSFFDTLTLNVQTVMGEPQFVYGPSLIEQRDSYIWGTLIDPVFGKSNAEIYLQPRLEFFNPIFTDAVLDSIVLILPYDRDTTAFYGDINEVYDLDVFRVTDNIERNMFYSSDTSFNIDPTPIGSKSFIPNVRDSIDFINFTGTVKDTLEVPAYLQVTLSESFGNEILALDSLTLDNDESFFNFLGGILIDPRSENKGLLSFDLKNSFAGMYIYYTVNDTVNRQYQIGLNQFSTRIPVFSHDYSGSFIEPFISDQNRGDSLVFVQGLAGVDTRIEVPHIQNLDGFLINKAELILELDDIDADEPGVFDPVIQLGAFATDVSSGVRVPISDFTLADFSNNIAGLFGGSFDSSGTGAGQYTLNLSDHIQRMISGEADNFIFISAFPKSERGYRSILRGTPGEVKIRVTFSRI